MRIKLNSIFVEDQDRALKFYTDVLGFKKSLGSRRAKTSRSANTNG